MSKKCLSTFAKGLISIVFSVALVFSMIPAMAFAAAGSSVASDANKIAEGGEQNTLYSGGAGTQESPYLISTAYDMQDLATAVNGGQNYTDTYFKVTKDIDLSDVCYKLTGEASVDKSWTAIGNYSKRFYGNFDGSGYTISNLYINSSSDYASLFGCIGDNAVISNFVVKGTIKTGASNYVSGVVGYAVSTNVNSPINIKNIRSEVNITSTKTSGWFSNVGGIVGSANNKVIIDCCANFGDITAGNNVNKSSLGGVVGVISGQQFSLTNCYNAGDISVGGNCRFSGAIAGQINNYSSKVEVQNNYNVGSLTMSGTQSSANDGLAGYVYLTGNQAICQNNYYLEGTSTASGYYYNSAHKPTVLSEKEMKAKDFPATLNAKAYEYLEGSYPVHIWEGKGGTPTITANPEGACYIQGAEAQALKVVAALPAAGKVGADGTLSYQWYTTNSDGEDIAIKDATSSSYIPSTSETADSEYWCVVTNSFDGKTTFATSEKATVSVNPAETVIKPEITISEDKSIAYGETIAEDPFKVTVTNECGDGELSYQWYTTTSKDDNQNGTKINGATSATYAPTIKDPGTTYYYCVVTDKITNSVNKEEIATTVSNVVSLSANAETVQIGTADELAAFATAVNSGLTYKGIDVKLTANIELSGEWTPIGNSSTNVFKGNFDGQYHKVTGLSINTSSSGVGLFGNSSNATFKNVSIEGSITNSRSNTGGLVGSAGYATGSEDYSTYESVIKNVKCNVKVEVGSQSQAAGVVGTISGDNIAIENCANYGNIKGFNGIGGIAGFARRNVSIVNCYNAGSIEKSSTSDWLGGIVGNFQANPTNVKNCYNTGKVLDGSGAIFGYVANNYDSSYMDFSNNYYLKGSCASVVAESSDKNSTAKAEFIENLKNSVLVKDAAWFASESSVTALGSSYVKGESAPVLAWEAGLNGSPVITVQPKAGTCKVGKTANTLSVEASILPGFAFSAGALSYQWYKSATQSTTGAEKIDTATTASYTPASDAVSSYYYYCVVTNTWQEEGVDKTASVQSTFAGYAVQSDAEAIAPSITQQPKDVEVSYGGTDSIEIAASIEAGKGVLTYQWYSNDEKSTEGAKLLAGETSTKLVADSSSIGTKYYYCVVTNTFEMTKTKSVTSDIVKVDVSNMMYINNLDEFLAFRDLVNGGNRFAGVTVKLCADIDLSNVCSEESGTSWTPISNVTSGAKAFAGTFDGAYHTIKGLYINSTKQYQGLFGYISNLSATSVVPGIRNLTVEGNCTFNCGNSYSGGIVGYIQSSASKPAFLENVCSKVNVSTNNAMPYVGNVTGQMRYVSVTNCVNYGTLTDTANSSYLQYISPFGFAREYCKTSFTNCYSLGKIALKCTSSSYSSYYEVSAFASGYVGGGVKNCYVASDFSETTCSGLYYIYSRDGEYQTTNSYYYPSDRTFYDKWYGATEKTLDEMKEASFVSSLGDAYVADTNNVNDGFPMLKWQAGIGQGTPTITEQPAGGAYSETATKANDIAVKASLPGKGDIGANGKLSYQWYSNTTKSNVGGTAIDGATDASFTPTIGEEAGTVYYYCVVTNTFDESRTASVTSDACAFVVIEGDIVAPSITKQPQALTLVQNATAKQLSVEASLGDNEGTLAYQWYVGEKEDGSDLTAISGATSATYTPQVKTAGTSYYACDVLNTFEGSTAAKTRSSIVAVKVIANANGGKATIDTQPQNVASDVKAGDSVDALSISASLPEEGTLGGDGTLHYQWYHNTTSTINTSVDEKVGTDSASYTPVVTEETATGYHYFYCVVSNEFSIGSDIVTSPATITSNIVRMHVVSEKVASAPVIVSQPQMIFNEKGTSSPSALSVEIDTDQMDNVGKISYQWYACISYKDSVRSNAISGATKDTYTPQVSTLGSCYYFCRITNTFEDTKVATTDSNVVRVFTWDTESATPSIETQPVGGVQYTQGDSASALSVEASIPDEYKASNYKAALHYQWYRNTTGTVDASVDTKVGTDSATYTPATNLSAAYYYYYCVVTNQFSTKTATQQASITSDIAQIAIVTTTPAATPTIENVAVEDASYSQMNYPHFGQAADALKVSASVSGTGAGDISYQWYYSTSSTLDPQTDTKIAGATKATYKPDLTLAANTRYYYCVATNTFENVKTATAISEAAKIDLSNIVISNGKQLYDLATWSNSASESNLFDGCTIELANDIDLSSYATWPGICSNNAKLFMGTFDGKGHTIYGLTINSSADGYSTGQKHALVGRAGNSTFKNFTIKGSIDIKNSNSDSYVGAVVGYSEGDTGAISFENVISEVNMSISANVQYVGGIAGMCCTKNTSFENCAFKGSIDMTNSPSYVPNYFYAGICGLVANLAENISFTNCYNAGTISGSGQVIGIAGKSYKTGAKFTNCFNVGQLTSKNSSGNSYAIMKDAANQYPGAVQNCYYLAGSANMTVYPTSSGTVESYASLDDMNTDAFLNKINAGGSAFKLGGEYPILSFEKSAGTPSITAQPKDDTSANIGETATALSVGAALPAAGKAGADGTLMYQWFCATKADASDAVAVAGASEDASSIVPNTETAGTYYYFCRVSNEYGEAQAPYVDSAIVKFTVLDTTAAATPKVTTQPVSASYAAGEEIDALKVAATVEGAGAGTLSYQWYMSSSQDAAFGQKIDGATTRSYVPTISSGTSYYYCVVTNTYQGSKTATATSDFAKVTVAADLQIKSLDEFVAFRDSVNAGNNYQGKSIELLCDIDLSSISNWTPIGADSSRQFAGSFNGNGHSITGLNINGSATFAGLFGYVYAYNDSAIENLKIKGSVVTTGSYAAGLVAFQNAWSNSIKFSIKNIIADVNVTGNEIVGGIVGQASGNIYEISSCVNKGNISSATTYSYVGGIAGMFGSYVSGAPGIVACYNTGNITSGNYAAGIAAYADYKVSNCYNAGTVAGKASSSNTGAVCGYANSTYKFVNNYYLDSSCEYGQSGTVATAKTSDELKNASAVNLLNVGGNYFKEGNEYPVLIFEDDGYGYPVIDIQPAGSWALQNGTPKKSLSVSASVPAKTEGGKLTYQWYKLVDGEGVAVDNATDAVFNPATSELGTYQYYCLVTNTWAGGSKSVKSETATFYVLGGVDPTVPTVSKQPQNTSIVQKSKGSLNVEASVEGEGAGTLSYQWYSCDKDGKNESAIKGATAASYALDSTSLGTSYYFCRITNTFETIKQAIIDTSVAEVNITTYAIESAKDLADFRDAVNAGNNFDGVTVELVNDIDLSAYASWTPIGNSSSTPFSGSFIGNGHSIKGFKISGDVSNAGLFGYITFKNTAFEISDFTIYGSIETTAVKAYAGVLGQITGATGKNCIVKNVTNNVSISGNLRNGGGIAYTDFYVTIESCINNADITSTYSDAAARIGGIIGYSATTIKSCANKGNISASGASSMAGGIIGVSGGTTMTACYNTGKITASNETAGYAAGIAIASSSDTISSCYNSGTVSGVTADAIATYATPKSYANNIYLDTSCANASTFGTAKIDTELKDAAVLDTLNVGSTYYKLGSIYPILAWEADPTIVEITKQPTSTWAKQGAKDVTLSVEASAPTTGRYAGTLTYQWYKVGIFADTAVEDATSATLTADATFTGAETYYCKVTSTYATGSKTIESEKAEVKVVSTTDAATPTVTNKTDTTIYVVTGAENAGNLEVEATLGETGAGTLTYQWYESSKADGSEATAIEGATDKALAIDSAASLGNHYYLCKVTNTFEEFKSASANSPVVNVCIISEAQADAKAAIEAKCAEINANLAADKLTHLTADELKAYTDQVATIKASATKAILAAADEDVAGIVDTNTASLEQIQKNAEAANLKASEKETSDAQSDAAKLQTQLDEANAKIKQAEEDLATANKTIETTKADLATANANLKTAKSDLETANKNLSKAKEDYAALQKAKEATDLELATAKSDLASAKAAQAIAEANEATAKAAQAKAEANEKTALADKATAIAERDAALTAKAKAESAQATAEANEATAKAEAAKAKADATQAEADAKAAQAAQAKAEAAQKAAEEAQAKAEEAAKTAKASQAEAEAAAKTAKEAQATAEANEAAAKQAQAKAEAETKAANEARDAAIAANNATQAKALARLSAGKQMVVGNYIYTVLSGSQAVSVKCANPSIKKVVIASTVKDTAGNVYKVTSIAKNAFANCSKLTKVSGGANIISVEAAAFSSCAKLKTVTISSANLTTIGSKAFYKTTKLTKVTINKTAKLVKVTKAFKKAGKNGGKKLTIKVKSSKKAAYKRLILKKGGNKTLKVK